MSDRAEELLTILETVCASVGVPVERDRVLPVQQNQAPLIVMRTGVEFLDPPDGARIETCHMRWTLEASVEHYVAATTPAANRAALNAAWSAFHTAFFASEIVRGGLIANGTLPDLGRTLTSPSADPKIAGQVFQVSLTFIRKN